MKSFSSQKKIIYNEYDFSKTLLRIFIQFQFRASYLELYNEEIRDLAKGSSDDAKHEIVGAKENKTIVTNIIEKEVKTTEEVSLIQ